MEDADEVVALLPESEKSEDRRPTEEEVTGTVENKERVKMVAPVMEETPEVNDVMDRRRKMIAWMVEAEEVVPMR